MILTLLAARHSIHTVRWCNALAERGHEVHLLSMHSGGDALDKRVRVHDLRFPAPAGYVLGALEVRRLLKALQPDLLHAHYASGYGLLGSLSNYHPYVLSVWGQDVYDVPYLSLLHRYVIKRNLWAADHVCSTSHAMAEQTHRLCPGLSEISVTPFGIDPERFRPAPGQRDATTLTIGTVKALKPKYGIDILVEAFAAMRRRIAVTNAETATRLRLLIVGGGNERMQLEAQARGLGIDDVTTFAGKIPHEQVPIYLNRLDIYVAASRSESFGVAVIEAGACEVPVVVSDVGGLPEVVEDGVTGFVVERESVKATVKALLELVNDPSQRHRMGKAGRERVLERYTWASNVKRMEAVYQGVLEKA